MEKLLESKTPNAKTKLANDIVRSLASSCTPDRLTPACDVAVLPILKSLSTRNSIDDDGFKFDRKAVQKLVTRLTNLDSDSEKDARSSGERKRKELDEGSPAEKPLSPENTKGVEKGE